MPELRPFRGLRYASADIKDLWCPPYDVVSEQDQDALYERHPNNAIRLELSRDDHSDAARTFERWAEEGVLRREEAPSLYLYRQDFTAPGGARRRVAGVIGALELEPLVPGSGVLPHENTMPEPIEDRLSLLRACPANISPLYAIYRGGGALGPLIEALEQRPTDARFADGQGTLHRLWVIRAPAEIEVLTGAVRPGPLVIADGHHRYETALAFAREQAGPGEHDSVMCFCDDADDEDIVVLPYHRALRAGPGGDLPSALRARWSAATIPESEALAALERDSTDHLFTWLLEREAMLVEISRSEAAAALGGPEAWAELDVVVLHELVLPTLLGAASEELRFSRAADEIARLVREEGFSAGVLLRALDAVQVYEVARSGMRMPQKASYFWPKAVTGLVFRSLR